MADQPWQEFGIIIDEEFLTANLPTSKNWQLNLSGRHSAVGNMAAYDELKQHMLSLRQLIEQPMTDALRMVALSHFYMMIFILGTHFSETRIDSDATPNCNLVNEVVTTINQNYALPISSAQLASQFHVSLTTLNNQFNTVLQMSVSHYIRLARLKNARRMLLQGNLTVEYIATKSGFGSIKSFIRNFKEWKGVTPSSYRKQYNDCLKNEKKSF